MCSEQDIDNEREFHCSGPAQFNCERCKYGPDSGTIVCDIAWRPDEEVEDEDL